MIVISSSSNGNNKNNNNNFVDFKLEQQVIKERHKSKLFISFLNKLCPA